MTQEAVPIRPLPLEDQEQFPGYWKRFGKTLGLAFTQPMAFFQRVPSGEGLLRPLGFVLILSVPLYLLLCLYPIMFTFMSLVSRLEPRSAQAPPFHWMALGCTGGILLLPFLQVLAILISSYVQSIMLRVWGVHDPGIPGRQDRRAWIYASAFMMMSCWTPLGPVALLAVMVLAGMGYARMHRAPTWRGVAASLTHAGMGLVTAMLAFLIPLVLVSRTTRPIPDRPHPSSLNLPGDPSRMSSEEIMTRHSELARITLNQLAAPERSAEATIDLALKLLQETSPPLANPYDPQRPAFRRGTPSAEGETGLLPLHKQDDPASGLHYTSGVAVEAWTRKGRIRSVIILDRP